MAAGARATKRAKRKNSVATGKRAGRARLASATPKRSQRRQVVRDISRTPQTTWIIVGDRSGAKIYSRSGSSKSLKMIQGLTNPAGVLPTRELVSDKAGRGISSTGGRRKHGFSNRETAHEHALTRFVHELGQSLKIAVAKQNIASIVLVGEPHFLGKLRKALPPIVANKVSRSIRKDLFRANERDLARYIDAK